jgi:3-oxoacyl-[acyl-carrier protein] reductase
MSTALVTGASRGIGRGIAVALAKEGYNIIINFARNGAAAEEVRKEIQDIGVGAVCVQGDIGNSQARRRLVDDAWRAFNGIDMLVNNAGIAPAVRADLLEATEESFDEIINTNLKGPYFLTQLVAKRMLGGTKTSSCKIINITSISAYVASINRGDYCVSKAGLAMMTQLYAVRLAEHGINVYEIRPGVIETDMTGPVKAKYDKMIADGLAPIRRWGVPDDVAKAVVAIAKDLMPFSTGEVMNIDGGFHIRRL